ncbi:MAG TPA: type II toxin-antitoxin system RelE/ParE family toxin [Terracidiphilus sp.]|nr:type II toxin-antitoxin system RelE/ParE family toxin [Terracidiphilus sp.]
MKKYEVLFRPRARKDLISLYRYIAKQAGPKIAANYIVRIEKACLSLMAVPLRGTAIASKMSGLRTMGFERRATVLFRVGEDSVEILRIYYGGQNWGPDIKRLLGI